MVIGVIAVIAVPPIHNQYNRDIAAKRLLHTFSVLSQAFKKAEMEYGYPTTWTGSEISSDGEEDTLEFVGAFSEKYLLPNLVYAKYGNYSIKELGYNTPIKDPDGSVQLKLDSVKYPKIVLNNGIILFLGRGVWREIEGKKYWLTYSFSVDVNGPKAPNIRGKDVFVMQFSPVENGNPVTMYAEYKYGWEDIRGANGKVTSVRYYHERPYTKSELKTMCSDASQVYTCGAYIKANGWEFPKDYPW